MNPALSGFGIGLAIGSIPFAWLVHRVATGRDLRLEGSGNPGATNALRLDGWAWGAGALLLDAGKGALAVVAASRLAGEPAGVAAAVGTVLGHVFTPWLFGRGGKGVAPAAGAFAVLAPAATAAALGVFALVVAVTRFVSLASTLAAAALPIAVSLLGPGGAIHDRGRCHRPPHCVAPSGELCEDACRHRAALGSSRAGPSGGIALIPEPVAIIGGGAWGTALAVNLGRRGVPVRLWMYEDELVRRMLLRRDNPVYLPGVAIPDAVAPTHEIETAVADASLVVFAVPTPFARSSYGELARHLKGRVPVVVATKGIEEGTLLLPTEVAASCLAPDPRVAALSGPSFAEEVARGVPTAVVVASTDADLARAVQDRLAGETLRLYTNTDVVGVQIAAALKNVVAIAAGIADGLGFGHNTLAALITRGLAEIRRLGVARGASPETFSGLASLGDLVLTCTGGLSRNRQVGQALGKGERLVDVIGRMSHVAEGVRTARSARDLARKSEVEMPIVEEVYRILYEDGVPSEAVRRLMARPLGSEDRGGNESAS